MAVTLGCVLSHSSGFSSPLHGLIVEELIQYRGGAETALWAEDYFCFSLSFSLLVSRNARRSPLASSKRTHCS
jgi:hypothetical protein